LVDRIAADWRTSGLDPATEALVEFGIKLTLDPSEIVSDDVERLREAGFDDAGISSCVQVVAYFNYINRVAEGLGVDYEDWIEHDGRITDDTSR